LRELRDQEQDVEGTLKEHLKLMQEKIHEQNEKA